MCKYCDFDEDWELNDIQYGKLSDQDDPDSGFKIGLYRLDSEGFLQPAYGIYASINWVWKELNRYRISTVLSPNDYHEFDLAIPITVKETAVNMEDILYCPFCGRKLIEDD